MRRRFAFDGELIAGMTCCPLLHPMSENNQNGESAASRYIPNDPQTGVRPAREAPKGRQVVATVGTKNARVSLEYEKFDHR